MAALLAQELVDGAHRARALFPKNFQYIQLCLADVFQVEGDEELGLKLKQRAIGDTQEAVQLLIRLPPMPIQPVAAADVALALADAALSPPANHILEVAGPDTFLLTDLAVEVLTAYEDPRQVMSDPRALYFGAEVGLEKLVAENPWRVASSRFDDWLRDCVAMA